MDNVEVVQHSLASRPDPLGGQILAFLLWVGVAVLSRIMWRRRRGRDTTDLLIAAGLWLSIRLIVLVISRWVPGRPGDSWLAFALDLAGLVILAWPFLSPTLPDLRADRVAGIGLVAVALACAMALWQWVRHALSLSPVDLHPTLTWAHSTLVMVALAILNMADHPTRRSEWLLTAISGAAVGAIGLLIPPPSAPWISSALVAAAAILAAFLLNWLDRSPRLPARVAPLAEVSPAPWRPSQWLEASTALFIAPDVTQLLKAATVALAYVIDLQTTGLILTENGASLHLRLVARHPPSDAAMTSPFSPRLVPLLGDALARGQIVRASRESDESLVEPLDHILGTEIQALLILPLAGEQSAQGLLLVCRENATVDTNQLQLCSKLADQVAVAVDHVKLRVRIVEQAQSLAHLIQRHKRETSRLLAILESITDGIVVSNVDDRIVLVNGAALSILALERDDILGRPFGEIANRMIRVGEVGAIGVVKESSPHSMEAVFDIAGRAVQTSMAPIKTNGGPQLGVVAVLRDVTPLVSAETKRELQLADLREQNRQLAEAAEYMRELVWSGEIELAPDSLDLQELVEDVVVSVVPLIGDKPVTLVRALEFGLPVIKADRARVRQVLFNLLSNAITYADKGQIAVSASRGRGYVVASVAHIGADLPPQYVDAVYEEFGRADNGASRKVDGLRLGLAMSRRMVELHGGKTWVRRGQVVIIYFGLPIDSLSSAGAQQVSQA